MKRVTMTVEFVPLSGTLLEKMSEQELAQKMIWMLEDDHSGIAHWGSAGVTSIKVEEI